MGNSMKSLILSLHKSHDYSLSKSLMVFAKESHIMEPQLPESQEEKVTNKSVNSLVLSLHESHDCLAKVSSTMVSDYIIFSRHSRDVHLPRRRRGGGD